MLQMSAMKACFQIAECSKSSAKIMENNGKTMENTQKVPIVVPKVAFLSTFGTTIELFCILKVDAAVNPSRFYSKQLLRRVPKVLKKANFGTTIGTFCVFSIVFPLFSIIFAEDLLHSAI